MKKEKDTSVKKGEQYLHCHYCHHSFNPLETKTAFNHIHGNCNRENAAAYLLSISLPTAIDKAEDRFRVVLN